MKMRAEDYQLFRVWFAQMVPEVFPLERTSSSDPLADLDAIERIAPAKARAGLSMAINDIIEMTDNWPDDRIAETDHRLVSNKLPSLSEMRRRFSKVVLRALRRGHIKDDVEYYAVRNAVDLWPDRQEQLWQLLTDYETIAAG